MLITPVIDLCQGQVVHAIKGQRNRYQPICSQLCTGSEPDDIVAGFLTLFPFETIYIADLDAIRGQGSNDECIKKIHGHYPQLNIWLDSGISKYSDINECRSVRQLNIIGSETGINVSDLSSIQKTQAAVILSLDFSNNGLLGNQALLQSPSAWPGKIIVMTLDRVGSGMGPDFERIQQIQTLVPDKQIFAAGGIRDQDDLQRLQEAGVAGALVATTLHNRNINSQTLQNFSGMCT